MLCLTPPTRAQGQAAINSVVHDAVSTAGDLMARGRNSVEGVHVSAYVVHHATWFWTRLFSRVTALPRTPIREAVRSAAHELQESLQELLSRESREVSRQRNAVEEAQGEIERLKLERGVVTKQIENARQQATEERDRLQEQERELDELRKSIAQLRQQRDAQVQVRAVGVACSCVDCLWSSQDSRHERLVVVANNRTPCGSAKLALTSLWHIGHSPRRLLACTRRWSKHKRSVTHSASSYIVPRATQRRYCSTQGRTRTLGCAPASFMRCLLTLVGVLLLSRVRLPSVLLCRQSQQREN